MESFIASYKKIFLQFKIEFILLLLALILVAGSGIIIFNSLTENPPAIKITQSNQKSPAKSIHVDIEGAVNKPGLYELETNTRLKELLEKAGGLHHDADQYVFARNFNLASVLKDEEKIYIPTLNESAAGQSFNSETHNASDQISINTASREQLDSLSGVGPTTVDKIISGRPYDTLDELVSKKILKASIFENVKEQLSL